MRYVGIGIGILLLLFVVGVGCTLVSGGTSILLAPFQGEVEKSQQVEGSGSYRVANVDYFFNTCGDIQTKQQNAEALRAAGEKDAAVANELQAEKLANEYNAAAANEYTKGQFKDSELPYPIDADKEIVSCGTR